MITPQQQPIPTQYDPLAIQFMTQGQMGYMPSAQFLTPAEYGAFRTMPSANGGIGYDTNPGWVHSYLIRNRGSIFGLPAYTFNTYNPAVNQQQYIHQVTRNSYDSMAASGATAADFGMNIGLSGMAAAMLGLSPITLPGMLATGVIGSALPNMASPFVNRVRDTRAMQDATRSKIVGGRDVNLLTGMGFNARAASDVTRFMRRASIDDALLAEGDYRELASMGIEAGLMDYAGNAQQYKDVIKKLRGNLTTFMEVLGSTDFRDSLKEMKRLQDMGATLQDMKGIIRKENAFSRIAGVRHADMVSTYGQAGALTYSMHGLNNYQGSLEAMSNAAALTLAQRQGLITESQLARHGGLSGMAQTMTEQSARVHSRIKDFMVSYFMNKEGTGLDSSIDASAILASDNPLEVMTSGAYKISNPQVKANFDRKKDELYGKLMDQYGSELLEGIAAMAAGKHMGFSGKEAMKFGLTYGFGMSAEIAEQKTNKIFSDDFRDQMARESRMARQKAADEAELYNNPFRKAWRGLGLLGNTLMEATFGKLAKGYTEWQENSEREAAGLRTNTGIHQTASNGKRSDPKADKTPRTAAAEDRFFTGSKGLIDKEDFSSYDEYERTHARVFISTAGETPTDSASTINAKLVRQSDGRLLWDRRIVDNGGMSFGRYQHTTGNMLDVIEGDSSLSKMYEGAGLSSEQRQTARIAAQKIRAAKGNFNVLNAAEREAMYAMQQAHEKVTSTEEGAQLVNMRTYEHTRNNNFLPAYNAINATKKGSLLMSDMAWQETIFGLSNLRGPNAASDVAAFLKTVSEEELTASITDPGKRQEMLERYRSFMQARLGRTYASRFSKYSAEAVAQRTAHAQAAEYARDPEAYKKKIEEERKAAQAREVRSEELIKSDAARALSVISAFDSYTNTPDTSSFGFMAGGIGIGLNNFKKDKLSMARGQLATAALVSSEGAGAADFGWLETAGKQFGLDATALESAKARILNTPDSAWSDVVEGLSASGSASDFENAIDRADYILQKALGVSAKDFSAFKDKDPTDYNYLLRSLLANKAAREKLSGDPNATRRGITASLHSSDAAMHEAQNVRRDSFRKTFLATEQNKLLEGFAGDEAARKAFIDIAGKDKDLADLTYIRAMVADRDRTEDAAMRGKLTDSINSLLEQIAPGATKEAKEKVLSAIGKGSPKEAAAVLSSLLGKDSASIESALALGLRIGNTSELTASRLKYYDSVGSLTESWDDIIRKDNYLYFDKAMRTYGISNYSELENDNLLDSYIKVAEARGDKDMAAALTKLRKTDSGQRVSYGLGVINNEVADVADRMRKQASLDAGSVQEKKDSAKHEALTEEAKQRKELNSKLATTLEELSKNIGLLSGSMKTLETTITKLK